MFEVIVVVVVFFFDTEETCLNESSYQMSLRSMKKNSLKLNQFTLISVKQYVQLEFENINNLGPVYVEVGDPWGNLPVHIVSHFILITFT